MKEKITFLWEFFLEFLNLIKLPFIKGYEWATKFSFENLLVEVFGKEAQILIWIDKIKDYFDK